MFDSAKNVLSLRPNDLVKTGEKQWHGITETFDRIVAHVAKEDLRETNKPLSTHLES